MRAERERCAQLEPAVSLTSARSARRSHRGEHLLRATPPAQLAHVRREWGRDRLQPVRHRGDAQVRAFLQSACSRAFGDNLVNRGGLQLRKLEHLQNENGGVSSLF